MSKVESADISFHISVMRIHTDEARSQERFQVAYGVKWRHHGIHLSMIGKDGHRRLGSERLIDFSI